MPPPPDPLPVTEIVAQQRFLRSVARQLVRDAATADDVVQESYLRAIEEPHARPRSVRAWLGRVVANLAHDRRRGEHRRERREQEVASAAGFASPADHSPAAIAARVEMHRRLADRVLALTPAYRDVVLLHHFEGLTVAQAAQRLGLPLETARTRLRRALEQLRTQLEAEMGGRGELLAALLPLATFVVPTPLPLAPLPDTAPTSASASGTTSASASTAATVAAAGGALIGVPLAMSTTSKLALAAVATVVAGSVWLFAGGGLGDRAPRVEAPDHDRVLTAEPAFADAPAAATPIHAERALANAPDAPFNAPHPLPGRAALRVKSVWLDGRVAPHVRLRIEPHDTGATSDDLDALRRDATNDAGELFLDDLEPGDVLVAAAGFAARADETALGDAAESGVLPVTLVADAIAEATLTLPVGASVRGIIVDGGHRPIAGAQIWVSDRPQTWCPGDFVATSDERGEFEVAAVGPSHYAAARANGFGWSEVVTVDCNRSGRSEPVELQLDRPGATIRGRIQRVDGAPIAGAMVLAVDDSRGSRITSDGRILGNPPPSIARSAADGTFTLSAVPFGTIDLLIDEPRFAMQSTELEVAAAEIVRDFTLEAGGTLDVQAVDGRGVGIEGATVQLQLLVGPFQVRRVLRTATTPASGRVSFDHIPTTPGLLSARVAGRTAAKRLLQLDGSARNEQLVLQPSLTLRGRVVDDAGVGCAGIRVELVPSDLNAATTPLPLTTDAEGRFAQDDCGDLPYEASFFHNDGLSALFAARRGVVLRPGGDEQVVVIGADQRAAASIRGRIVAADSQPLATPSLQFAEEGGHSVLAVPVMADGRFELGPLPAGNYWLIANADGLASRSATVSALQPGEVRDLGDLALERAATLIVRARRDDGVRTKPADLELRSGGQASSAFTVDGDTLRREEVAPGDYTIEVVGDGLAWQRVPVHCEAGRATEVALDLETGVKVKLALLRADGAGLGATLRLVATDSAGESLDEELRPLPADPAITIERCLAPGEWTLEVTAADGARAEATVTLARGAPREVLLELATPRDR